MNIANMESRCAAITLERKAEELQIAGQFKNFRFAGWRLSMIVFRANLVEAGGVEPIHATENTQVADSGTPPIPLTPPIPSTFAQFCSLVPPEGLAAIVLLETIAVPLT